MANAPVIPGAYGMTGLDDEARSARYSDPEGMLRGWTTLIHGVLTSYGYLHD